MKLLPTLVAGGLATAAVASPLVPVSFQMPGLPASVTGYGASGGGEWAGEPLDLGSRHVLFLSTSANLVASDGNGAVLDLFRRDRKAGRTDLVSLTSSGRSGTRPVLAFSSAQSGDRVAFSWQSNDRAAGDTNGVEDVYVRDITAGTTRLVSARADGSGAGNAASGSPAMASGGRYVAFQSEATDLVGAAEEDGNRAADIFLRDLETGTTELISATPAGVPGDRASRLPIINHDGSVIVFQSDALTLAPIDGYGTDLMVWTRTTRSVKRISIPGQAPSPVIYPLSTEWPVLSDDGRYLAFFIAVTGSSPVPAPYSGVWWFDLASGERLRASGTTAVSLSDGEPSMSSDGRTLAFTVRSRPAVDAALQVRVWTPEVGMKSMEELRLTVPPTSGEPASSYQASLAPDAASVLFVSAEPVPEAGVTGGDWVRLYHRALATGATRLISEEEAFYAGEVSSGGGWVMLETPDPILESGDDNGATDVVLTRLSDGHREVVSLARTETGLRTASGASLGGDGFSDDGQRYAFVSLASDIAPGDTNGFQDAFVYESFPSTNVLVSRASGDSPAAGAVTTVTLSRSGTVAGWISRAAGITPGDTNTVADAYVRDVRTGITELVSAVDGTGNSLNLEVLDLRLSGDGRWVAFRAQGPEIWSPPIFLYLRDVQKRTTRLINGSSLTGPIKSVRAFELSADGMKLLFYTPAAWFLYRADRSTLDVVAKAIDVGMSADGRRLVSVDPGPGENTGALQLRSTDSGEPWNILPPPRGRSIRDLKISADGAVLTYVRRVRPDDLPAGNPWQVWALSTVTRQETLISSALSGRPGGGDSREPSMSADGRIIAFRSFAPDLVPDDTNEAQDVFARDRHSGVVQILSQGVASPVGNQGSARPNVSGDGRLVAFTTYADNLVARDFNGVGDVVIGAAMHGGTEDADRDGLSDGWEREHFAGLAQNGAGDPDGDGLTNAEEFALHTVPTDRTSAWWVRGAADGPGPAIEWTGHAGVSYRVEHRATLGPDGPWEVVWDSVPGYEGTMRAPLGSPDPNGYYRVSVR